MYFTYHFFTYQYLNLTQQDLTHEFCNIDTVIELIELNLAE